MQVQGSTTDVYDVDWPDSFNDAVAWLKIALGDLLQLGGFQCVTQITYYDRLQLTVFLPLTLCIACGAVYLVARHMHLGKVQRYSLKAGSLVAWVAYPAVSLRALQVYVCQEVSGVEYLKADYSLECSGAEYDGNVALATLVVIFFVAGFPLGLAGFLWYNRAKIQDQSFKDRYG